MKQLIFCMDLTGKILNWHIVQIAALVFGRSRQYHALKIQKTKEGSA